MCCKIKIKILYCIFYDHQLKYKKLNIPLFFGGKFSALANCQAHSSFLCLSCIRVRQQSRIIYVHRCIQVVELVRISYCYVLYVTCFSFVLLNLLNAELNPICHLLALLGAHHIFHVSRIRVNCELYCLVIQRNSEI